MERTEKSRVTSFALQRVAVDFHTSEASLPGATGRHLMEKSTRADEF